MAFSSRNIKSEGDHNLYKAKGDKTRVIQRMTREERMAALDVKNNVVEKDSDDFMYSDTVFEVAKRNGVDFYDVNGNLDFTKSYGPDEFTGDITALKKPEYSNNRIWRIFSVMAPSRGFKRTHDFWGSDYPFSVKVETPATVHDVMALNRDHYEGSDLDMTQGFDAGPFGSPIRYDPGFGWPGEVAGDNANNLTQWDRMYVRARRSASEASATKECFKWLKRAAERGERALSWGVLLRRKRASER